MSRRPKKKEARNQVNEVQKSNQIVITPKTAKQKELLHACQTAEQVFAVGPAGTGKTYIPTKLATKMLLRREIDKIVLTRPAVEVGESHGFLPGDIHRKLAPWVVPIIELIQEDIGADKLNAMLRDGTIEVAPFAYMRGRTFKRSYVILDEAQNTTPAQMEMFLTRLGEGSRVCISGDLCQTDMKSESGLAKAIRLIQTQNLPVKVVEFGLQDIVRSGICQMWAEAFQK